MCKTLDAQKTILGIKSIWAGLFSKHRENLTGPSVSTRILSFYVLESNTCLSFE